MTADRILNGSNVTAVTADKIASAMELPLNTVFEKIGTEKKLSNRTILHHHRLISSILTCAIQWQIIMANSAERVKPPKVEEQEVTSLSDDEMIHMLELLEKEPLKYQVAVYIAVMGGLRLGEVVGLKWSNADFETGVLKITKTRQYISELGDFEKAPKTKGSKRELTLPQNALEKLKE